MLGENWRNWHGKIGETYENVIMWKGVWCRIINEEKITQQIKQRT